MSETVDLAIQIPDLYEERGWHAKLVYPDGTLHCETCHEAHLDQDGTPAEDGCWPCAFLQLWDRAETLAAENAEMREALEFYADFDNWRITDWANGVHEDVGNRARAALAANPQAASAPADFSRGAVDSPQRLALADDEWGSLGIEPAPAERGQDS